MSAQKPPAHRQFDGDEEEWPEPDPEELRLVQEHLDQLEKEGILIKGDGLRGSLRYRKTEAIETAEHESEELRQLFKQLAELRAKGIISGGDGPRDSLKPTAHVPGALARFLADGR